MASLILACAGLDSEVGTFGKTALMLAAEAGHTGGCVPARNEPVARGRVPPLHEAARVPGSCPDPGRGELRGEHSCRRRWMEPPPSRCGEGRRGAGSCLLATGAEVDARDAMQEATTPIHRAVEEGKVAVVRMMKDPGANTRCRTDCRAV